MKYLGRLPHHDPLHAYLQEDVFSHLDGVGPVHGFRVFRLQASNDVFLYEETQSRRKVIGKFFLRPGKTQEWAWERAHREWDHLRQARALGLDNGRLYVPAVYGLRQDMNSLLIEEFCVGTPMTEALPRSLTAPDVLYSHLTDLALLLARLHNTSAGDLRVDFGAEFPYFDKVIGRLQRRHRLRHEQIREAYHWREQWAQSAAMWSDVRVLIHGDATPANFLFAPRRRTIAIDLERMRWADRAYDLGMVAGELKHYFLRNTHQGQLAEPFIGHFLWEYSTHFPDRYAAFRALTARVPFYMGLTLLRIARNSWLDWHYSQVLVHTALATLRR